MTQLAESLAVEPQRSRQVGGEAAVVVGMCHLPVVGARHRHPLTLGVEVGEHRLACRPLGEGAEETVDQGAAFGRFEPAQYRDPLVKAHPKLIAGDSQTQLFKSHVVASYVVPSTTQSARCSPIGGGDDD